MRFSDAIAEEARRFRQSPDDTKFLDVCKPCINLAHLDVGKSWRWPHLKKTTSLVVIPVYDTGTANITQDSNRVTLVSPAAVVAGFKGRFFRKEGSGNNYRILSVDTTNNYLYLDQPIVEDTESGIEYEIEKMFYTLPTEVREIIGWDRSNERVLGLDHMGLRQMQPERSSPLNDIPFEVAGTDEFTADYSTGQVSATAESNTITGTGGMAWLTNVQPGNIITFSDVDYRVKRVETDTQLVLYNKIEGAQGPVSYTISVEDAMTVRPLVTFSEKRLVRLTYIRKVFDMIHDDDRMALSQEAKLAVLDFAEAYIAEALGKENALWQSLLSKAQARLTSAQALSSPVRSAYKQFPPLIARGMGRR